jgi:hypothetical protein
MPLFCRYSVNTVCSTKQGEISDFLKLGNWIAIGNEKINGDNRHCRCRHGAKQLAGIQEDFSD